MPPLAVVHLQPAPIPHGGIPKWSSSGRSISSALSPSGTDLAVFVAPKEYSAAEAVDKDGMITSNGKRMKEQAPKKVEGVFDQDRAVYFGQWGSVHPGLNQVS